jgi:hypothetical protein
LPRLKKVGVTKEQIAQLTADIWKPKVLEKMDLWSRQYVTRGHIWGDEPSRCATHLAENLPPASRIMELGSGYGRDGKFLVDHGFNYEGIDNAEVAVWETMQQVAKSINYNGNAKVSFGDIVKTSFTPKYFDAVTANRVLHLPDPEELAVILNRVSASLNSEGRIVFTLRRPEDFDENEMVRPDPDNVYLAEYGSGERKGERLYFYDKKNLEPLLSRYFTELSFQEAEEPDALDKMDKEGHLRMTKLIMVTGRKKTDLERENGNGSGSGNGQITPDPE